MNEQHDANANDVHGWPLPSQDVQRELDPPAIVWSEAEPAATPQIRRPARG
jgi:hypothetical protein